MIEKLKNIIASYEALTEKMGDPAVLGDQKEYARLAKEHSIRRRSLSVRVPMLRLTKRLKMLKKCSPMSRTLR